MDQIISDYLLYVYITPIIAIVWAEKDIKSFIVIMKVLSVLFLIYGMTEANEMVNKSSRYISKDDQIKIFFVALSPFFLVFSGVFLNMACLNSILETKISEQLTPQTNETLQSEPNN